MIFKMHCDILFQTGIWTFLWFICFCFLANQWSKTDVGVGVVSDAARAVVAFSFFSIVSWVRPLVANSNHSTSANLRCSIFLSKESHSQLT